VGYLLLLPAAASAVVTVFFWALARPRVVRLRLESRNGAGREGFRAAPVGLLGLLSQATARARAALPKTQAGKAVLKVAAAAIAVAGYVGLDHLATKAGWPNLLPYLLLLLIALLFGVPPFLAGTVEEGSEREHRGVPRGKPPTPYAGEATIPAKVYEGDSHEVFVRLEPSAFLLPHEFDEGARPGEAKVPLLLKVPLPKGREAYLEAELLAAGVEVRGDMKQQQPLSQSVLTYRWNCYFKDSGRLTVTLVFRVATPTRCKEVASFRHEVLVAKLDHMTKRQVWLVAVAAGLVTFVSTVLTILDRLHLLGGGTKLPGTP
jgi:hypothetical protein